jgi:hypothetical protein
VVQKTLVSNKQVQENKMIIHKRKIRYGEDYPVFFETLTKIKAHLEQKHPEVSVDLMYNLAGERGWATMQTRYASLAEYERIDAEVDKDENYAKLFEAIIIDSEDMPVDQFYRVIQ